MAWSVLMELAALQSHWCECHQNSVYKVINGLILAMSASGCNACRATCVFHGDLLALQTRPHVCCVARLAVWNSLSVNLQIASTLATFKNQLETYLFANVYQLFHKVRVVKFVLWWFSSCYGALFRALYQEASGQW